MTQTCSITTGVDRLLALVNDRRELTLREAAHSLHMDSAVVEEWSDLLVEAGLVYTEYTLNSRKLISKEEGQSGALTLMRRFSRQSRSIIPKKGLNEREKRAQEQEMRDLIRTVEERLATLKKYETLQREQEKLADSLKQERKDLTQLRMDLLQEKKDLTLERIRQLKVSASYDEREASLEKRYNDFVAERDAFAQERKAFVATQRKFQRAVGNVVKVAHATA